MSKIFEKNFWGLILGGSSGFGLASAKKLASLGMNIVVIHRDRKGSMPRIEGEFNKVRSHNVSFISINENALTTEGRCGILDHLMKEIGPNKIRLLLHSIALGNLKVIAPYNSSKIPVTSKLAHALGVSESKLQASVDQLFQEGCAQMVELATPPSYDSELVAGEEDFGQTIYNMGTSLVSWVQEMHERRLFTEDARVIGLTSEGNEIAWKGYAAVSAAKLALEAVARSIAKEFAPFGVRCNILQPGITDTPALRAIPGNAHMKARALLRNPMSRLTTPEDVGNVVALMCMDEAAWINGAIIRVDGGEHIAG